MGHGSTPRAEDCENRNGPFLHELLAQAKFCGQGLCGQIYQTRLSGPSVAKPSCLDEPWSGLRAAVTEVIASHGIVILGEIHDNAAHHRLQAAMIVELAAALGPGARPAVVFEQFRTDQQSGLDQFGDLDRSAGDTGTVANLKDIIAWDKSGWPDLYDPLFEAVIKTKLPIIAGDPPRAAIMKAAKEGEAAISAEEKKRLGLDVPLGDALEAQLRKEIEDAHCGMLPRSAFEGMIFAQRYRDSHLADTTVRAADRSGAAILVTGAGHARTDRGVPRYVRQQAPQKKVVSVVFVEVEDGATDAAAYVPRDPDGRPAADFVIFTERTARGDPCEQMRKK
jgi:uncharacterized iron-regulated protein